eukprot:scaffold177100_cov17-Tisochrysis_lutea.AAC.2
MELKKVERSATLSGPTDLMLATELRWTQATRESGATALAKQVFCGWQVCFCGWLRASSSAKWQWAKACTTASVIDAVKDGLVSGEGMQGLLQHD